MTEGFQVPMVSRRSGCRRPVIGAAGQRRGEYPEPAGEAPNVILQTRDTRSASLLPYLSMWPTSITTTSRTSGPVHMFTDCAS